MFWFSVQLLSKTFLILKRTERDVIKKMYIDLHVKYPIFMSDFNETRIFWIYFRRIRKYQISWKSVHWEPSCSMRTNGQTMTKQIVSFRNSTNAPKNAWPIILAVSVTSQIFISVDCVNIAACKWLSAVWSGPWNFAVRSSNQSWPSRRYNSTPGVSNSSYAGHRNNFWKTSVGSTLFYAINNLRFFFWMTTHP